MLWHPQTLRDPRLAGSEACWTCSCDPGRPTGLAILHCAADGAVHAASTTLQFGKHPACSWGLRGTVAAEVMDGIGAALFAGPGEDPRGEWWEYAGEDMGAVYEREGTSHAKAQAKRVALQRVARLEGQIAAGVSEVVSLRGEALYPFGEWRALLTAASASADLAKSLAANFVRSHFGAWVSSHEAEAICIGLHHLRVLRQGERVAARPLLEVPVKGKRGKRPLPEGVLRAMAPRGDEKGPLAR